MSVSYIVQLASLWLVNIGSIIKERSITGYENETQSDPGLHVLTPPGDGNQSMTPLLLPSFGTAVMAISTDLLATRVAQAKVHIKLRATKM